MTNTLASKNRWLSAFLAMLGGIVFAGAGCSSIFRDYTGQPRPVNKVGDVTLGAVGWGGVDRVCVISIDNKQDPKWSDYGGEWNQYELLPGRHTLVADILFWRGLPKQGDVIDAPGGVGSYWAGQKTVTFLVKAGHAYLLKPRNPGFLSPIQQWALDVVDTTDGGSIIVATGTSARASK